MKEEYFKIKFVDKYKEKTLSFINNNFSELKLFYFDKINKKLFIILIEKNINDKSYLIILMICVVFLKIIIFA